MANYIEGWRLIRLAGGTANVYHDAVGMIDYRPSRKWRIEKKNAFNPIITHRREEYREDQFELQAYLTPDTYAELIGFLSGGEKYYLEYMHGNVRKQYPVQITSLPECPDDMHEYPGITKFSLESKYIGTPGYFDWTTIIVQDDDEIVTSTT
jgi:hypothetical protein